MAEVPVASTETLAAAAPSSCASESLHESTVASTNHDGVRTIKITRNAQDQANDPNTRPESEEGIDSEKIEPKTISDDDGWVSADDPANPLNWSIPKRAYHTVVPGLVAFCA